MKKAVKVLSVSNGIDSFLEELNRMDKEELEVFKRQVLNDFKADLLNKINDYQYGLTEKKPISDEESVSRTAFIDGLEVVKHFIRDGHA
ncbi:hypothetical protein HYS94_01985 [Candidatus Daviesbacteria bacterium]|nr:hypothetical protein [Candidatus Daviesbacteria bacterium]